MFVGNLNNSEVISTSSFAPFLTRHVKFCPHSWIKQIALRVELYGCRAKGKYTIILRKVVNIGVFVLLIFWAAPVEFVSKYVFPSSINQAINFIGTSN